MSERATVPFDTFSMQIDVPVSQLVCELGFAWSCGQCPLDRDGQVLFKFDLVAQSEKVCDYIEELMHRGGLNGGAVTKLVVYYVALAPEDRTRTMELLRRRFGAAPLIVPVAVPHFYYEGMLLEVDVFAGPAPRRLASTSDPALGIELEAIRGGDLTWVTLRADDLQGDGETTAARSERIITLFDDYGLSPDHLLSDHWFASADGTAVAEIQASMLAQNGLITHPAAMVTTSAPAGAPLLGDLLFSSHTARLDRMVSKEQASTTTHSRRAGRLQWTCGTCADPGLDLVAQTRSIMRAIERALSRDGMTFEHLAKLTARYVGGASVAELHDNMIVRHGFYSTPGPASTGLPIEALHQKGSRISIDTIAIGPGKA